MPYKKLLFALLLLFIISGILALVFSQKHSEVEKPADSVEEEINQPKAVGQNVSFVVTEGERKKWKIEADEALYYEDQTGADLFQVRGQFYNAEGQVALSFTAPEGKYFHKQNQVRLTGGVVAQSESRQKEDKRDLIMKAPTMQWSSQTKEVLAEGGVDLDYQVFGESTADVCRFTLDLSSIVLEGNVQSQVRF